MEVRIAQRKAAPTLTAIAGTTGAGKTYSALSIAGELAGPSGKVGFVDTEQGRGEMYTDEKALMDVLPGKQYHVVSLPPPHSPARYLEAIAALQNAGCTAIVIDSVSHEFEGEGGITDLAENNKLNGMPNWALAKREHKKFINKLLTLPIHVILCLRAREKTKPEKQVQPDGKVKVVFVEHGVQPIQEKNFMFEMTFSVLLDPVTHFPQIIKCPEALRYIFPTDKLIDKTVGTRIRAWSEGGAATDLKARELRGSLTAHAYDGMAALESAFTKLSNSDKLTAKSFMDELKKIAAEVDARPKDDAGKEELF